ncbi:unnamed protein product [Knipowitschia caucasica]
MCCVDLSPLVQMCCVDLSPLVQVCCVDLSPLVEVRRVDLSPLVEENEFVLLVLEELEALDQKDHADRLLLFPPLPSRLRYLTHRTVEECPQLCSFSVGEGVLRRVLVCSWLLRAELKPDDNVESCGVSPNVKGTKLQLKNNSTKKSWKRPDRPLYQPRAARERPIASNKDLKKTEQLKQANNELTESERLTAPNKELTKGERQTQDIEYLAKSEKLTQANEGLREIIDVPLTKERLTHTGTNITEEGDPVDVQLNRDSDAMSTCGDREHTDDSANSSCDTLQMEAEVWDEYSLCMPGNKKGSTVKSSAEVTVLSEFVYLRCGDASVEEAATAVSEGLDLGTEEVCEEVRPLLRPGSSFRLVLVKNDFSSFGLVSTSTEEFNHVIEIHDFPAIFTTEDLKDALCQYSASGMKIMWVDDTHALAVFSNEAAALEALSITHPLLKTRPLSQASKKSKGKALRRSEFLLPMKPRPRTDAAVAQRMVSRALGLTGRDQR